MAKTHQKWDLKTREIDWSFLCLQHFSKVFNMKCMQWPETEVMWIYWNLLGKIREITLNELIFGGFTPFETTVRWLHLEAKKLDPSRSHDFPHQWFAIDSLNHRRSNIILFGKTTELIALQNSLSRVSIYYHSVRTQTSDQRAKGKKCNVFLQWADQA